MSDDMFVVNVRHAVADCCRCVMCKRQADLGIAGEVDSNGLRLHNYLVLSPDADFAIDYTIKNDGPWGCVVSTDAITMSAAMRAHGLTVSQ